MFDMKINNFLLFDVVWEGKEGSFKDENFFSRIVAFHVRLWMKKQKEISTTRNEKEKKKNFLPFSVLAFPFRIKMKITNFS